MHGLMQDWPLNCSRIIDHAATQHPRREIVSYGPGLKVKRSNYRALRARALRVGQQLLRAGIRPGDRVATLATSTAEHLEVWYGAVGIGAVYHPLNARLGPDQLNAIIADAEDSILFADAAFAPLVNEMRGNLAKSARVIHFDDGETSRLRGEESYASWLSDADGDLTWPMLEERSAAALFYTSGTTGKPKGVLYSHRSIVLLSLTVNATDMYGFSSRDVVLFAVPMYHANGWSWPFTAPMSGASVVLPGANLDAAALTSIIAAEGATISAGVPTLWQSVLDHVAERGGSLAPLRKLYIGGAPCPRQMLQTLQDTHGIDVVHAWGMTEMGPTGSLCTLTPETAALTGEQRLIVQQRQGKPPFLVEMKLTDDADNTLPWDDRATGRLKVRGPCVVRRYFRADEDVLDADGYFDTGDIGRIDENGYMLISDRAKDLVRSGGEWISSVELENAATTHSAVKAAAVVAARHPKWGERPILVLVLAKGSEISLQQMREHMAKTLPSWQLPDDLVVVDTLPLTAIGKIDKARLRALYSDRLVSSQSA
ncbi:MAG: long-chain-fatty-acid--CoA ligase [Hyphomonadaceae bacterium]|nr:long-chain-fatty-acid--CoA ligase [Hyphomonadaceae bacterium]